MTKRLYLIIYWLCLIGSSALTLHAQELGEWNVYPSYQTATKNVCVGSMVYSLMNGNLLRYDTEDQSVKTYDYLHDLNDVSISHIAYSSEAKRFILVYDNQNIDLMDLEDNIVNIASLKDKAIAGKEVNNICIDGKLAYLATQFGYVVIDMAEGVILDSYVFNINVQDVAICNGNIWMCGMSGVHTTSLDNKEMHNLSSWKVRHTATNWMEADVLGNEVFMRHTTAIYYFNETTSKNVKSGKFTYLKTLADGKVYFGNATECNICTAPSTIETIQQANTWNDITLGQGGIYWISDDIAGLRPYQMKEGAFVAGTQQIQPNSPRRDLFYRMHYESNGKDDYRLLVAGGINTYLSIHNPTTAMMYEDGNWSHFDEDTQTEQYAYLRHWNTTDIVQDPKDPSHHYASPYRTGIYEYRDMKLVNIYNCDNCPLRSILPSSSNYRSYVSATCLKYDPEGNLWMCNQETDTIIRVLTPEGKWHALYYEEIAWTPQCDGYLFSTSDIHFLVNRRLDTRGIFAFDTNGTLGTTKDDRHILRARITNQDGTPYAPENFYCIEEDLDGRLWCGTELGLFVIDDPTTFFDNDFRFTQVKIPRNDGSGLADYLLNGVNISCIAVDGGNRKWIGTTGNGIYLVSADGTEMLQHFLADETPLLSDNIQCIAIHPHTGQVMIGTDKGLCSYMSDATQAEEELEKGNVIAYPNPVGPDHQSAIRIEGLTHNAEVKICSVSGQLIWTGRSNGGTCTWNGLDKQGKRVASGIYNVISNNEDGKKAVVTRIIVIK